MLVVSVLPTLLFLAAGFGWCGAGLATMLSQIYCVAILVLFGARVGWVVGRNVRLSFAAALFAGSVGSALAAMKYVLQ